MLFDSGLTAELSGGCGRRSVVASAGGQRQLYNLYCNCTCVYSSSPPEKRQAMLLATALLLPLALALSPPPQTYVNTAIARTVELGGATAQVTTQYNIKATADEPGEYHLALSGDGDDIPAWWEVAIGGKAVEGVRILDDR